MSNLDNTKGGKANRFAPSGTLGRQEDRLPMPLGPRGPCQIEVQLAIAQARLLPIASLMQQLDGKYVGDENGLGESSLSMRVDSTGSHRLAERLLEDMDGAGLAPSVVVIEHSDARYDAETGCFVYSSPA